MSLFIPVERVDPVEHGADKRAPCAFSGFVGGAYDVEPVGELKSVAVQLSERRCKLFYYHGRHSSLFSRAARPKRTAIFTASRSSSLSAFSYDERIRLKNIPVSVLSAMLSQTS